MADLDKIEGHDYCEPGSYEDYGKPGEGCEWRIAAAKRIVELEKLVEDAYKDALFDHTDMGIHNRHEAWLKSDAKLMLEGKLKLPLGKP